MAGSAFVIRLLHVLSYDPWPTNDMAVYVRIAVDTLTLKNLFTPEGLSWFPPGYPIFLKPFLLLLERDSALLAVRVAQATLGAWTVLLIYRLAREIHSRRAGIAAAIAACFYSHFVFYSSAYMSENLFIPLYLATLLRLLRATRHWSLPGLYLTGLLAAVTTLVRPAAASLAPAALCAAWSFAAGPGEAAGGLRAVRVARFRALAVFLAGGLTLLAPWVVRNRIACGHYVLVAPNSAFNLAVGNFAGASGEYEEPPTMAGNLWDRTAYHRQIAEGFVTNDPWGALWVAGHLKWQKFWELIPPWPLYSSNPGLFRGGYFFPLVSWRCAFGVGLLGAGVLLARRRPRFWVTPACFAAYAAFYMLFFGGSRFRLPAEAFFLAWSGAAVAALAGSVPPLRRMGAGAWGLASSLLLIAIFAQSAWSATGVRGFLPSSDSFLASGDQVPVVPGKPAFEIVPGRIPLDRSRGRYLHLGLSAFRQGPARDVPNNGYVQITFFDDSGRTLPWLDNPKYFLEALPPDRWVPIEIKIQIPTTAASCRVTLSPERSSPDVLILDQPTLRYARGNDLALEFLHPYLRFAE